MNKNLISFALSIMLLMMSGCAVSVNTDRESKKDVSITEAEYPLYVNSMDNESVIKLYFADEDKEIPYIDTDTVKELTERMYHDFNNDDGFQLSISKAGEIATLTRENKAVMTIDSENDVIGFDDYDLFCAPSWSPTIIDFLEHYGSIDYLKTDENRSYSRSGSKTDIDLGEYGIDILEADGKCFIPLQTFSDTLIALPCYVNMIYNGEAVFAYEFRLDSNAEFISNFYRAKTGKRSRALADFTYDELCMVLDHFYGLKEQQGIEEFDDYFEDTGLKEKLLSEDPEESDKALAEFLCVYLDDLHSFYSNNSYLAGSDFSAIKNVGSSYRGFMRAYDRLIDARKEKYPDGVPGYEEIDNTAYITFDVFDTLKEGTDYYKDPPTADTKDTVGLLLYSFEQITRKDSPIENVVFDLSLNTGGDQTTTCFMLGMILGECSVAVEDTMTGAYMNESFRSDANLDGSFDEKDNLTGYNLFCITSPSSFSCGNLAASELKNSHIVTMLGQTSGGGTCTVLPLSLADGTLFRVSSYRRMTYIKNGSLYDIDRGVEPDLYIAKPSMFYDREALTQYINSCF